MKENRRTRAKLLTEDLQSLAEMSYARNADGSWVTLWEADLLCTEFEKSSAVPKISLNFGVNHPSPELLVLLNSSSLASVPTPFHSFFF